MSPLARLASLLMKKEKKTSTLTLATATRLNLKKTTLTQKKWKHFELSLKEAVARPSWSWKLVRRFRREK